MDIRQLAPDLWVGPQIGPADMAELARRGFKAIIGNRPEGETPEQPDWNELEAAARSHGLEARQIPVVPGQIGDEDVAAFKQALAELPTPIAAFCRTGTRSTMLWALANPDGQNSEERIRMAAEQGYDISGLRKRLEQGA